MEGAMTWGIPSHLFLEIHVVLSLIGIVSGLLVLYGLLNGITYPGWTAFFLATTYRRSSRCQAVSRSAKLRSAPLPKR